MTALENYIDELYNSGRITEHAQTAMNELLESTIEKYGSGDESPLLCYTKTTQSKRVA